MLSIHLHRLIFHAHHGLYAEEKLLGSAFEINLTVKYYPQEIPLHQLDKTIDYVALYDLVKIKMAQPVDLLETFVTDLSLEILRTFKVAEEVSVSIQKLHPPISEFEGSVGVSFEITRSDLLNQ
jgi:dihydroneopterin aldolase